MIVPIRANLEGITADRFLSLARTLARSGPIQEEVRMNLLEVELQWAKANISQKDQKLAFDAAVRVLLDLERLGWKIREEGYGVELYTSPIRRRGLSPEEIIKEKQKTRELFLPIIKAQLSDPTVRIFVKRLETPPKGSKRKSISLLIAEGPEIHARLNAFKQTDNKTDFPIKPYLQLATKEDVDEFTGHSTRDIWRYFRYTWSIPQFATPGRQLLYLIRDAGHPCHAIMGIISLNNTALQMGVKREYRLGWNLKALTERLLGLSEKKNLLQEYAWLESQIELALEDIESKGLADQDEIKNPDPDVISRLKSKSKEYDSLRDESLRELALLHSGNELPLLPIDEDEAENDDPPVSDEVLKLESKKVSPKMQQARRLLVARKRSALLANLLQARMILRKHKTGLTNIKSLEQTIIKEEVGIALQTVLDAVKSRFAGVNILEISTCGAIAPYNYVLGGKLAALLLYSPQIAADYQRIYSGPSIISSQIKNKAVRRENTLVYLSTTSLYAQGSSQYERVKLPPGLISSEQKELRFEKLGHTAGYGTLQFTNETRQSVETFLKNRHGFKDVNRIFGEGPSPKLRLLASGLRDLGFDPETLMRHNRLRIVYMTALAPQSVDFLNNRQANLPDYIMTPHKFQNATENIAKYWSKRWLVPRLQHVPSMTALLTAGKWKLSDRIPFLIKGQTSDSKSETNSEGAIKKSTNTSPQSFNFWKQIAQSGTKVTSDSLSEAEFERLHVKFEAEDYIKDMVSKGCSVFLTGNAGDGKTHLLKSMSPELRSYGARVIEDATAIMRKGQISRVLESWRDAISAQAPFCIAINEYPLHLLRAAASKALPVQGEELDHQGRNRLAYGTITESESQIKNLVIIDLSLRNPLNMSIARRMLGRLLNDPGLDNISSDSAPMIQQNLERLRDSRVQDRFLILLNRLAEIGIRTTMRELWIFLARVVLGYRTDLLNPFGDRIPNKYSEAMFQIDPRFDLMRNLVRVDPSINSHPIWDILLEDRSESIEPGWWFGVPNIGGSIRPDRKEFQALKRVFYFEHEKGDQVFDLEDADVIAFRDLMRMDVDDDVIMKRKLVHAINRAFCPKDFRGCDNSLYLWSGHRFHEQPTRSFLANRYIPLEQLRLFKPRIPERVSRALPNYQPDHLILQLASRNGFLAKLRVDFPLFRTLQRILRGLSRKLLPERDAFRLESFIESLQSSDTPEVRSIYSAHLERRELLEIQLSQDNKKYERITKH